MNLIEDLKLTINLVIQDRKIWLLSFLSLLYLLFTTRDKYGTIFVALIMSLLILGSFVFSIIGHGGLILAANRLHILGEYDFKEIWAKSKGRSFRIFGVYIRLFPLVLLFIVGNYFIYAYDLSPNWIYLERLIGSFIIGPIIHFGMCGIVIHDKKASHALKSSIAIYKNLFKSVFSVKLVYDLVNMIFIAIVYFAILIFKTNPVVPKIDFFDYSTIQVLLKSPIILWAKILISFFTWPFFTVIMTIFYNRSASDLEHVESATNNNSG